MRLGILRMGIMRLRRFSIGLHFLSNGIFFESGANHFDSTLRVFGKWFSWDWVYFESWHYRTLAYLK